MFKTRSLCAIAFIFSLSYACGEESTADPAADGTVSDQNPTTTGNGSDSDDCFRCGDTRDEEFDPTRLCEESGAIFADLTNCTCDLNGDATASAAGLCVNECADNACAGLQPSKACGACIDRNCSAEADACLADR